MRNYQCKKCGTLITKQSCPSSFNCPNGNMHDWTDLGECGSVPYQCGKCGTLIYSKSFPRSFNCPNGNMHDWNKL